PRLAAVGGAVEPPVLIHGDDLLRTERMHGAQREGADGLDGRLAERPRPDAIARQNRPVLTDSDEATVREAVYVGEVRAVATADLNPARAAVGGLEDEAAAEADVAGLGVCEDGRDGAERARTRARRSERLRPRLAGVGGVEQVAVGTHRDDGLRVDGRERARTAADHRAKVGPRLAAVGGAENLAIGVEAARIPPCQHDG